MRIRRRTIREAPICLLLGVVLTVGLAWALALWQPIPLNGLVRAVLRGEQLDPRDQPTGMRIRWFATPTEALPNLKTVEVSAGYPLTAMRLWYVDDPRLPLARGLAVPDTWFPQWASPRNPEVPAYPIPVGFAIDTAFYAGVSWLLLFAPFALRHHMRERRGCCRACGYELGELMTCPECGNDE